MVNYIYFSLDGIPCRIKKQRDNLCEAEIYQKGSGFVKGPKMEILSSGQILSKEEFSTLLFQYSKLDID